MTTIYTNSEFLNTVFHSEAAMSMDKHQRLIQAIEHYFTSLGRSALVTFSEGTNQITVEVDTTGFKNDPSALKNAVRLCESGKFDDAIPILESIIKDDPSNSEANRILGQIMSESGDQDAAIGYLHDAYRWNPQNAHALLMLGNIAMKFQNDKETARWFYDEAYAANPHDQIILNNIAAALAEERKLDEAKRYFELAIEANPKYPNSWYGLGNCYRSEGNTSKAFEYAIEALRRSEKGSQLFGSAYRLATESAHELLSTGTEGYDLIQRYAAELESRSGKPVRIVVDDTISTPAKIEIAEQHGRDEHLVKYKSTQEHVEHLVMHELVHLDLQIQARQSSNGNKLFLASKEHRDDFMRDHKDAITKVKKTARIPEDAAKTYMNAVFNGMNSQIYNAPIDLFIEDFLYATFPELRPYQYLSLSKLAHEAKVAVTDAKYTAYAPSDVLKVARIYNLVSALHLRELYGFDVVDQFRASKKEMQEAEELYEEYRVVKDHREAGGEYDLVANWGDDLGVSQYFHLEDEQAFLSRTGSAQNILQSIADDPYNMDQPLPDDAMTEPMEYSDPAGQMAVTMYCVSAIQHFENMDVQKIREVAYEIALIGAHGIDPRNTERRYHLKGIPNKEFTGLQLLAYMYVSWKIAEPTKDLGLNFAKEYESAKSMLRGGGVRMFANRYTRKHFHSIPSVRNLFGFSGSKLSISLS